jgi:hypothetical protein
LGKPVGGGRTFVENTWVPKLGGGGGVALRIPFNTSIFSALVQLGNPSVQTKVSR